MTIQSLNVPWAGAPSVPAPPPDITGVDVLPGYASASTAAASGTLSHPWSERLPAAIPQLPEVTSLIGMALSE